MRLPVKLRLPPTNKGFTLIEILVAIVIIGILASIAIYSYQRAMMQARDRQRIDGARQLAVAVEAYFQDYGYYPREDAIPPTDRDCDSSIGVIQDTCDQIDPPGTGWGGAGESPLYQELVGKGYIKSLPVDPINNTTYFIKYEDADADEDPDNNPWGTPSCTSIGVQACRYYIKINKLETKNDPDPRKNDYRICSFNVTKRYSDCKEKL